MEVRRTVGLGGDSITIGFWGMFRNSIRVVRG